LFHETLRTTNERFRHNEMHGHKIHHSTVINSYRLLKVQDLLNNKLQQLHGGLHSAVT